MRAICCVLVFIYTLEGLSQTGHSALLEKIKETKQSVEQAADAGDLQKMRGLSYGGLQLCRQLQKDTISAIFYQYLGDGYDGVDYDSSAYYFRLSLAHYHNITFKEKVYLFQSLIYAYMGLAHRDSLLHYTLATEKMIDTLPDNSRVKLKVLNTIADAFSHLGKYEKTLGNYRFIIQHARRLRDTSSLRSALINLGTVYNEMGNDTQAIYYTRQSLPYMSTARTRHQLMAYGNLSEYYCNLGMTDSAKIFLNKAKIVARQQNDEGAFHYIEYKMGSILLHEKKYAEAEQLLKTSLDHYRKHDPGLDLVNVLLLHAGLDTALKKYAEAEKLLLELEQVTAGLNLKLYRAENLQMLARVSALLGKYEDAYNYQHELTGIRDSIKTEKVNKDFAELQTEYEAYKKEEQIQLLRHQNTIRELEVASERKNYAIIILALSAILATLLIIFYVGRIRSRARLQHIRADLEMKALRSQMNPHFIFNSLNSIQKYIWENKQENAAEYLTRFARLMRLVLENSLHPSVKLTDELNALRLYIEMEHWRNNQQFDYTITVAENIDVNQLEIPPLLLQPYVENAIWHGLSQKDSRGKLSICIEKKDGSLLCTIDDNGVGRHHHNNNQIRVPGKKSLGINISSQRIAWLEKDSGHHARVDIIDKTLDGRTDGTTVLLTLPLICQL